MYKASQGLTGIADVDTGLKFLDKTTVAPYDSTKSRYEGTGTSAGVPRRLALPAAETRTMASHPRHNTAASAPPPRAREKLGPGSRWLRSSAF